MITRKQQDEGIRVGARELSSGQQTAAAGTDSKPLSDEDLAAVRAHFFKYGYGDAVSLFLEIDRLRAENARQAETIASLDSYAKRLESDSVRQAETIARLRELVTEFADHAADSAWHNTAEELRRRLREALKETP